MSNSEGGVRNHLPDIIKVIGIGQSLRGDDAAGLAAVCLWYDTYQVITDRPNVQMELAELPGIGLLDLLAGARAAILVDAVHSGAKAGTIHELSEDQLESFQNLLKSAHGWGVAETLALGRKLMPAALPARLILIGIEVSQLEIGSTFSSPVELALPEAARTIEKHIALELPRSS